MLDELTPEQLDEWLAYWELEPFGCTWHQSSMLAAVVHNVGLLALSPYLEKAPELLTGDEFLPNAKPVAKTEKRLDAKAFEEMAKAQYGHNRDTRN